MATTGQYAMQGGMGALGGAAAGLQTGLLFGAAGGPLGAGIGAGVGLIGGLVGAYLDSEAQAEAQAELDRIEAEYEQAQALYNSKVAAAGAAAQESVRKGMAAKAVADNAAVQNAMDEAGMAADKAGLIGAEKAAFIADQRVNVEGQRAASSPEVFSQALGGARQEQAIGAQQAAVGLQAALNEYQTDTANVLGQELPNYAATIGEGIGAIGAASGAVLGAKGVGAFGGEAAKTASAVDQVDEAARGGDQLALAVQEARPAGALADMSDAQRSNVEAVLGGGESIASGGVMDLPADEFALGPGPGTITSDLPDQSRQLAQMRSELGASRNIDIGQGAQLSQVDTGLGMRDLLSPTGYQLGPQPTTPTYDPTDLDLRFAGTTMPETYGGLVPRSLGGINAYEHGGMAGKAGPEVAVLGEEGPELVLNAEQTQGLAQALGAKGYAAGGVAGLPQQKPNEELDPDELEAYMAEMSSRLSGAI